MCSPILSFYLISFFNILLTVNCNEAVGFRYVYDYLSNVESKLGENEYSTVLNYIGKVELSSAYSISATGQELILVKLTVDKCDELKYDKSVLGIVLKRKGLVEKIIVDNETENGLLNLLKGVINLMSIDETHRNQTEIDISGQCEVKYNSVNKTFLVKEKQECTSTKFHSSIPETLDSFSVYQDSKIKIHYTFGKEHQVIVTVNSLETHLVESVLSDQLSQTFRSTTSITFNHMLQSSLFSVLNINVDNLIKETFDRKFKEIYLIAMPEISQNPVLNDKSTFIKMYKEIMSRDKTEKRAQTTMELMNLLRKVNDRAILKEMLKDNKDVTEMIHEALIACGSKICSESLINEFDFCLVKDIPEANRILLLMQHVNLISELMVKELWNRLMKDTFTQVYDQGIQTISSLLRRVQNNVHMKHVVEEFVIHINGKLFECMDEQCILVHLTAIRNVKMPNFYSILQTFLSHGGNYSQTVMASVYNTLSSLSYNDTQRKDIRKHMLEVVKREINFYRDSQIKSEAIFCLVRLECETGDIISVLNSLQNNDQHLSVFLIKKLKELINMGIIKDGELILESKFFQQQNHYHLTYTDPSNMLVNQLMTTPSLYSDIHFNIIGENGGVIRNSMTDIFLLTTAYENHLFSIGSHITGLQAATGVGNSDATEEISGLLQLVFFGKEARPIKLFEGTSQFMSVVWYAPSSPESLLRVTFFPIDVFREITFQNGIVLNVKYMGSTHINFLFQLHSNLWYKTANSLLNVDGQAYIIMETNIKSLTKTFNALQSFSLMSGLDFESNIDFSNSPMKNCLSVSRPKSYIHTSAKSKKINKLIHSNSRIEVEGSCYSLSRLINQVCATF